jgi:hypothetical protein
MTVEGSFGSDSVGNSTYPPITDSSSTRWRTRRREHLAISMLSLVKRGERGAASKEIAAEWLSKNKPPDWLPQKVICTNATRTADL